MLPAVTNLLASQPASEESAEQAVNLLDTRSFRLEHLVSYGQASAPGFWYDQPEAEWVLLLAGKAELEFEAGILHLGPGDSIRIPAHLRHRVRKVSRDARWLALHFPEPMA